MVEAQKSLLRSALHKDVAVMCTFYMFCSAGMSICNKLAIKAMPLANTLVIIQMLFCDATLILFMKKDLHFGARADVLRWSRVVPSLFAGMLVTSMMAFQTNSLSTVVVCRNITPLVTLFIESLVQRTVKALSVKTIAALVVILVGVGLHQSGAGKASEPNQVQSASNMGTFWMFANMTIAVVDRLAQRHMLALSPVDISKNGLLLLNNSVGAVFLIIIALLRGEASQITTVGADMSLLDWTSVTVSCVVGMCIGYAGLATQALISATSFMVLTNLNKFIVIAFGIVFLGDASTPNTIVGCTLAILGGVAYSKAVAADAAATGAQYSGRPLSALKRKESEEDAELLGSVEGADEDDLP